MQYVGETGRCLAERLTDHKSNIKTKKLTPISIHFNQSDHNLNRDLKAIAIEKITDSQDPVAQRKEREIFWQNKLSTRHPHGLNNLISALHSL